jgi:hypothetical protein
MFIGHFAVGLASKRVAPKASLGVLIAAPLLLDLLWPFFLLAGWEKVRIDAGNTAFTPLDFISYPYSHSLAMAIVWAALFGLCYWTVTRYPAGAITIGLGVVSHWVLMPFRIGPICPCLLVVLRGLALDYGTPIFPPYTAVLLPAEGPNAPSSP